MQRMFDSQGGSTATQRPPASIKKLNKRKGKK
jgi:hypothetical protein